MSVGYISMAEHSQESVIIFEKFSVQDPVSGFVSFPVPVGVEFRSLGFVDLQIPKKINRTLATLVRKRNSANRPHSASFHPTPFFFLLVSLLSPGPAFPTPTPYRPFDLACVWAMLS